MEPRDGSRADAGRVAGPGVAGVVARPTLLGRLGGPVRVALVSAPAGSGKTVLLQSWMSQPELGEHAAWVDAGRQERDPQRFWVSVLDALRQTDPASGLVREVTAAPDLDGLAITEQLLQDLVPLDEPVWLVIDDVHELGSDALRQLELLVMRAPAALRFVLATRHDVRLGLHRLRLEGELAEIRAADMRFTLDEARQLLTAAGVNLSEPSVAVLHARTEGWAAGLRLAALSLAGHPDPERVAAGFSGTERTVAEYLLAEVLDRQSDQVRRLLLRTSVLVRVNGELADVLTGDIGGDRALQDLEQVNAFVVSLDPDRNWFRYHQLFAELLTLELRRTAPEDIAGLHQAASAWFAGHGFPVEAIRHAQAARNWPAAARLLADHWPALHLDGQAATVHELLARFPSNVRAADSQLAAIAATAELAHGSPDSAERYLRLAERGMTSDPEVRGQPKLLLGVARLLHARQRGDPQAVAEEIPRLQAMADAPDSAQPGLGQDLRALALINLGISEVWTGQFQLAERHLGQGVALAGRIGRPFLDFSGQAHLAAVEMFRSYAVAAERSRHAIELADHHGWTSEPAAGTACMVLGTILTWQGRLHDAEPWVERAERTLTAEAQPAAGHVIRYIRGLLELARGRDRDALAAFRAAEPLARELAAPHYTVPRVRALMVQALVRLGDIAAAEHALAEFSHQDPGHGETGIATAVLRLAQGDPQAAVTALAPVLDGGPAALPWIGLAHAFLLEAIAQDTLGDPSAAGWAMESALNLIEPDGALALFLLHPAQDLLERHARHGTAHPALIAEILGLLAGQTDATPEARQPPLEPLSDSEIRVLRYLPTNLTRPAIAAELYVSVNTVNTHMRSLYAKLGTHRRAETVTRARDLGLLAQSGRRHR